MNNDKVIELAKKCNADLTTFDGEPLSYTFAIANLEKFVELLQSQSEPVARIIHTQGTGLLKGKTITKVMLDFKYVDLPAGTELFTHPQIIEQSQSEPVSAHAITSMQTSEALNERNKLGYAVADVIGKLDEIIDVADEVEVNDFLHKAIPIDLWHELQEALENMPARAESFTSIQGDSEPITKIALENTSLKKRIATLEDLLSSTYNIANRNGENTHWHRFAGQLHINGISPVTPKTFKILPSDVVHDRVKGVSDTSLSANEQDVLRMNYLSNGGWEVLQDPKYWTDNLNLRQVIDREAIPNKKVGE